MSGRRDGVFAGRKGAITLKFPPRNGAQTPESEAEMAFPERFTNLPDYAFPRLRALLAREWGALLVVVTVLEKAQLGQLQVQGPLAVTGEEAELLQEQARDEDDVTDGQLGRCDDDDVGALDPLGLVGDERGERVQRGGALG